MTRYTDKVVIITGASEGIGAEMARQLAPEKPKLVLAARRVELQQKVVDECIARGADAIAVRCDVGIEADCKVLADAAMERFGLMGFGAHSNDAEYIFIDSIEPRLYLAARLIIDIAQGK